MTAGRTPRFSDVWRAQLIGDATTMRASPNRLRAAYGVRKESRTACHILNGCAPLQTCSSWDEDHSVRLLLDLPSTFELAKLIIPHRAENLGLSRF
eukprot:TRINITY_DN48696_c0_g1_i1.p1 TRINITY_DN48696_c0_g1~~TRINITY_DN48696_c0_g1_i1.p1  ORF type:complete len:104 (+),score=2.29 TRINITY_DN48696_c0_g1_i1:26-313(+)